MSTHPDTMSEIIEDATTDPRAQGNPSGGAGLGETPCSAFWKSKGNRDKPYSVIHRSFEGKRYRRVFGVTVLLDLGKHWRRKVYVRQQGGLPFDDGWFYHPNRYVQAEWDTNVKGWKIELTNYCCGATGDPVVIPWTKHQRWIEIGKLNKETSNPEEEKSQHSQN